jgi:hypothetical protein
MSPPTFPQPGAISCPTCTIKPQSPTATLQIQIDSAHAGQLRNPSVLLNGSHLVVLPRMSLAGGSALTIEEILLPEEPLR